MAPLENRERAYLPEKTWDKLLGELEREGHGGIEMRASVQPVRIPGEHGVQGLCAH